MRLRVSRRGAADAVAAIGFLLVNTGNYDKGIQQFTSVIRTHGKYVPALLGRGTAFALSGALGEEAPWLMVGRKAAAGGEGLQYSH